MQIVAEIGINHNGDLEIAKQLINMAKSCSCDYVKFQKRTIEKVYTKKYLDSPRESPWGSTQREQKEALEFDKTDFHRINIFCIEREIKWFASCWDLDSLALIEAFNPPLHKIASPMLTNDEFVKAVAGLGRKTLISTWNCLATELGDRSILEKAHLRFSGPLPPCSAFLR